MPTQKQNAQPFKKAYIAALPKLIEAGVSAKERIVYDSLTRLSELKGHGYTCTRAQKDIATETGLTERHVKDLVLRLRGRFFHWNGALVPVIQLLKSGSRGHPSIYRDNLTAYVLNPEKDPIEFLGNVGQEPKC